MVSISHHHANFTLRIARAMGFGFVRKYGESLILPSYTADPNSDRIFCPTYRGNHAAVDGDNLCASEQMVYQNS